MKTLIKLLVFLFLINPFQPSQAGHVMGVEITYKCTSTPGIFEITEFFYRRCDGIPLCSGGCGSACGHALTLKGADATCSSQTFGSVVMNLVSVRDVGINPLCPGSKNNCTNMGCATAGTFSPGYERYEFVGFANIGPTSGIPAACCNVRIIEAICCRNSADNMPGNDNFYSDIIINRCLSVSPCNNSPVFGNDPILSACPGQEFIYNPGATDPDHDSLSYAFAPALADYNVPSAYSAPYSFNKPFPWTGNANDPFPSGIHCDPVNGDIMFTPVATTSSFPALGFAGPMVIEITEWRTVNGVPTVLSRIRREMVMTIYNSCIPNNQPKLTTNPASSTGPAVPQLKWSVCEGEQLCFTIKANDADLADTTYLSWNAALADLGALFTPNYVLPHRETMGPREDNYQFCWTPGVGTGKSDPYYFSVTAKDQHCTNPGRLTRSFSVLVTAKPSAQIVKSTGNCFQPMIAYTDLNPNAPITSALWKITTTPNDPTFANGSTVQIAGKTPTSLNLKVPGRYYIELTAATASIPGYTACSVVYLDSVDISNTQMYDSITANNITCKGGNNGSIILKGKNGVSGYLYKIDNHPYGQNNIFTGLAAGTYIVSIKNFTLCVITDTVELTQPVGITIHKTITPPLCTNQANGNILLSPANGSLPYSFKLDQGTYQPDSFFSNMAPGTYRITVKDSNNCEAADSVTIPNTNPIILSHISTPPLCFNQSSGNLLITPLGGSFPYEYKLNEGPFQSDFYFDNLLPGHYKITVKDDHQCLSTDSVTVANHASTSATYTSIAVSCNGLADGSILFDSSVGITPVKYAINGQQPQTQHHFQGLAAGSYKITLTDVNNCLHVDSVLITEPGELQFTKHKTAITCNNADDGILEVTATGGTAPYTLFFGSRNYTPPATIHPIKPGIYPFRIIDQNGCSKTDTETFVNPPLVAIGVITGDSFALLNSNHTYQVTPQPNLTYHWTIQGGSILSGENSPTVSVRWESAGSKTIQIAVVTNKGCTNNATKTVQIGTVGLNELSTAWGLNIYPNPTKNTLTITVKQLPENETIGLYDIQGRLLRQESLKGSQQLDLEDLSPGMYMLKIGEWRGQIIKE